MSAQTLPRRLRLAGQALRGRGVDGVTARTAGFNVISAGAAALGGLLLARTVGPTVRGEYAAAISWFGMLLLAGEMGQTAAVCFYVAHDPRRARGYVATARATMLATGAVALAAGFAVAPVLAHGNPGLAGAYRLTFGGSVVAFTAASYTSSLQARSIGRWNLVRASQPALGLAGTILLWRLHMLTLNTAIGTLIASMTLQLGLAYYWCRRCELAPGCAQAKFAWPLLKYGLSQLAAIMPTSVNAYLDQLLLTQVAQPAALGCYAIAVSVTGIPVPLVSAIGNVAFPRLAAQRGAASLGGGFPRAALLASAGLASAVLLPVAVSAHWLIPLAFGAAYRSAVPLVWILAPGGVFLASGQVAGDLLRGLGRPGLVAAAQGLAAVFTVVLLLALLPVVGVPAAAIASTIAYGVALAAMIRLLWRLAPAGTAPSRTGGGRHRQQAADLARDLSLRTGAEGGTMRIGVIGPTWPDSFAYNIIDALSGMGHHPVSLGSSYSVGGPYTSAALGAIRNAVPGLDERGQRRIVRAARDRGCEVIVNVEQRLMPSVVGQLRRNGARVALWFPDALLNMGRQLMLLAPYNAIFVKEPYLVDRLRAVLDLPLFYLPEACNARLHQPLVTPGTEQHLVIAGNMYPSRIRLLERLMAAGIPLRLYGAGFPRWVGQTPLREVHAGRPVFGAEKARALRSAVAVLNNLHPAEICGVNARLFEAAGCGAAVLTEFRPTLGELFVIGDEVLAFRNFDELVSQARRLLAEGGLSAKLGDAAAQRAHECHTYEKRLEILLDKIS